MTTKQEGPLADQRASEQESCHIDESSVGFSYTYVKCSFLAGAILALLFALAVR